MSLAVNGLIEEIQMSRDSKVNGEPIPVMAKRVNESAVIEMPSRIDPKTIGLEKVRVPDKLINFDEPSIEVRWGGGNTSMYGGAIRDKSYLAKGK